MDRTNKHAGFYACPKCESRDIEERGRQYKCKAWGHHFTEHALMVREARRKADD